MLQLFAVFSLAQTPPSPKPPKISFVDIAAKAGLTIKTEAGGEKSKKYIIETTGSGAAFFDYDDDGWQEVEQHAYCSTAAGRIEGMDLVCSGFRPVVAPSVGRAN